MSLECRFVLALKRYGRLACHSAQSPAARVYHFFFYFLFIFFHNYTNSILAISAPSETLFPILVILKYPPVLSLYLGAITSKSFFTSFVRPESLEITSLFGARPPALAEETSFSINGLNSFAFGRVVLIFSRAIRLSAKEFISALRPFLFMPNFLLLL